MTRTWKLSKKKVRIEAVTRGKTLAAVAESAGYGKNARYIYRALSGGDVMLSTVGRIADALGCEPCEIIEAVEESAKS